MQNADTDRASQVAVRFCHDRFPECEAAFLCGSWARGQQHVDSDIDVVIVDPTVTGLRFEGTEFMGFILDICAANRARLVGLFQGCAANRSAPIMHQIIDSIQILGGPELGSDLKRLASDLIGNGPNPLSEVERRELRWELSTLAAELSHSSMEDLPSLSAQCHVKLSGASLAIGDHWRGERKALPRAVRNLDPELSRRIDNALARSCAGDRAEMLRVAEEMLGKLGGMDRTYCDVYE